MAFEIIEACGAAQVQQVRALLRDYVAQDLVDLSSQNIDAEIAGLPGRYAAPSGTLLLATDRDGTPAGCVAIHKFGDIGDAEMKRLFVAPTYRGLGLGKRLVTEAIDRAAKMGFTRVVLDTMPDMKSAIATYEGLGFRRIRPYWENVLPVIYFGKML
ncbi:GNAT family N-acetyltransferase [Agrobacterium sp. DE0009]|uniref:GNAT family N-acetyltransferase n=1 Tax=Agrobacterium sp. DE0009 TaxID=2587505 RepID=UPI0011A140BF|nr:GNAT family N-acetyltransferase [Agrobacterium sp. DE0009]